MASETQKMAQKSPIFADKRGWHKSCKTGNRVDPTMTNETKKEQAALETLVIAQLAAIRKREAELQTRLQSNAGLEPVNVAAEVWQLQTSADRLSRMMDAMNFGGACAFA
jgi:hypothetical protein